MLLTSRSRYWPPLNVRHQQRNVAALFSILLCIGLLAKFTLAQEEGDACQVRRTPGVCTPGSKCIGFDDRMKQLGLTPDDVVRCGIGLREEIVCCPEETTTSVITTTMTTTSTTTTTTTTEQPQLIINGNVLDKDSDYYDLAKLLNGQNRQNEQNNNGVDIGFGTGTGTGNWQPNPQIGNPNNNFQNVNSNQMGSQWENNRQNVRNNFRNMNNDPNNNFRNVNSEMNNNANTNFRNLNNNGPNPNHNFRAMNQNPMNNNWQPNEQFVNPNSNFQDMNNNPRGDSWGNGPNQNIRNHDPMNAQFVGPNNNFQSTHNNPSGNSWRNGPTPINNFQKLSWENGPNPNIRNQIPTNSQFVVPNNNPNGNSWRNGPNPNNNFQKISWENGPNPNIRNHDPMNAQFVGPNNNFQSTHNNPSGNSWRNGPNPNINFQNTNNNPRANGQRQQRQKPSLIQWPKSNNSNGDTNNRLENVIAADPIATINNKLRNEGLNIVQATLHETNGSHQPQQEFNSFNFPTTTTPTVAPNTFLEDPFQRFQFRPQTFDNDIEHINSNDISVDRSVTTQLPILTPQPTIAKRMGDSAAKRACADIEKQLQPLLTPHIIGGTPVELGEYPHMVAIGFSTIGNQGTGGPYSFRCGGALIDHRFVLTAAHCVNHHELTPEIVRMGVVNFTDPDQMRTAVEIRISETHIHPNYKSSSTYNDIAVLELERDVRYTETVFPICLYTDFEDPPANLPLYVSGWGTINTQTRETSTILLKARQQIVAAQRCNESYVRQGLNRRISEGIVRTQLCTTDPEQKKDACQGDSGGPLTLVLDESKNQYSLVGVISAGFSCASSTPGLYSRVAAFVDFIESIVWPTTR